MRGRGLKHLIKKIKKMKKVAPHAGAWIETHKPTEQEHTDSVAPHAGAWIETLSKAQQTKKRRASPPMRGRGLKPR